MLIQYYLTLLNKFFPNITPLSTSKLKNMRVSGKPLKFKANLTQSRAVLDNASITNLLKFFSAL